MQNTPHFTWCVTQKDKRGDEEEAWLRYKYDPDRHLQTIYHNVIIYEVLLLNNFQRKIANKHHARNSASAEDLGQFMTILDVRLCVEGMCGRKSFHFLWYKLRIMNYLAGYIW